MFDLIQMFRKKKYEASIYFIRELEEPPQREDDLPYFLIRLHDIYIKKRNVHIACSNTLKTSYESHEPTMMEFGEMF